MEKIAAILFEMSDEQVAIQIFVITIVGGLFFTIYNYCFRVVSDAVWQIIDCFWVIGSVISVCSLAFVATAQDAATKVKIANAELEKTRKQIGHDSTYFISKWCGRWEKDTTDDMSADTKETYCTFARTAQQESIAFSFDVYFLGTKDLTHKYSQRLSNWGSSSRSDASASSDIQALQQKTDKFYLILQERRIPLPKAQEFAFKRNMRTLWLLIWGIIAGGRLARSVCAAITACRTLRRR